MILVIHFSILFMKKYNLLLIALSIIAASCNQKPQKVANDNAIVEGNDTTKKKDTVQKAEEVKKADPEVDGVDLGLSVNWATHNVGASAPHKVGYLIPLGNVTGTKKSAKHHYEQVSGESDIATVKMGKEWRMPTAQEMLELIDKCEWEKKTVKGVKGAKVTGPSGESIFLPAPGECIKLKEYLDLDYDWQPNDVGTIAWYWCGTPLEYRNCLHFRLSKGSMVETSIMIADTETFCNAVRAVKEK